VIKQFPPEDVVKHPSGTGPFRLVLREEGSRIVFERFDKYWAGTPYLERLIFRTFTDQNAREAALLAREIDMISIVDVDMVNRFKGRFAPTKWGVQEQFVVRLNARHPFTKDVRVRQALNYALNRDELVKDLYRGVVTEARGPYSPSNPGWNPSLQGYRYDLARAKQLLTEAGFGAGARVRAIIPTNSEVLLVPEVTQIIQADLRKVGVDVSYDTMEWSAYLAKLRAGLTEDHIFMVTSWGADYMFWLEQQLGKTFWPPNGSNLNWYANPEVEKLFDAARLETRDQARKKLYQQAEELITRDAAWLFTFYQPYFTLHTPKLQGIGLHYWGLDFSKAWLSA
jgi:peptide/nickel transport system substrate-binding protein